MPSVVPDLNTACPILPVQNANQTWDNNDQELELEGTHTDAFNMENLVDSKAAHRQS